jgi:xanthine dehydrogenase molybdopterin-binding subunit B
MFAQSENLAGHMLSLYLCPALEVVVEFRLTNTAPTRFIRGGGRPVGNLAVERVMDALADAAHNSKPRPGVDRVRLPGERGLQRYREQTAHGVALYPTIMPALAAWADKYGVFVPVAIGS